MKKILLPSISALLLLLILISIPGKDSFKLEAADLVGKIASEDYIITEVQVRALEETREVVLVDLNSRDEYQQSALPGAVNLPLSELSVPSLHKTFAEPVYYVLYSEKLANTCNVWILLTQMGFRDILVLSQD